MSALVLILGGLAGLIGTLAGAYVTLRTVRPQQDKIIAETGKIREEARDIAGQAADRMIERYRDIVRDQDAHLEDCEARIEGLEKARRLWLTERDELRARIAHLETVLARHGLNGG